MTRPNLAMYKPRDGEERPEGEAHFGPDQMRRDRSQIGGPKRPIRREMRRAELVCAQVDGRPSLVAVVYPRDVAADLLRIQCGKSRSMWLGNDFSISCRCGERHEISGEALRAAVLATSRPSGRGIPAVRVAEVARRA